MTEPKVGDRYGYLTVIGDYISRNGRLWPCRCDCGKEVMSTITSLNARRANNSGCNSCNVKLFVTKHGHGRSSDRTYSKYQAMKQRCTNPNHVSYSEYGGRGVKVCERWMKSFEAFLEDMGECPPGKYSIERIDPLRDYEPSNCKWIPFGDQAKNTRRTRSVVINGVTYQTMKAACDAIGVVSYATARMRVATYGWSVEKAVTTPTDVSKRKKTGQSSVRDAVDTIST